MNTTVFGGGGTMPWPWDPAQIEDDQKKLESSESSE